MQQEENTLSRDIRRLQENLTSIRKIAGWTVEKFGYKIGASKQTISNLANGKTTMNFMHYIVIRLILDYEVTMNKENKILSELLYILLDKEMDDDAYTEIREKIADITASVADDRTDASLIALFMSALGEVITISAPNPRKACVTATAISSSWIGRIMAEANVSTAPKLRGRPRIRVHKEKNKNN